MLTYHLRSVHTFLTYVLMFTLMVWCFTSNFKYFLIESFLLPIIQLPSGDYPLSRVSRLY